MENAVFPDSLESLDITACPCMLPVFAGRKVHVSWNLALSVKYDYGASDRGIDIANHMLAESVSHSMRRLVVGGKDATPPELITYKGLTHLQLNAPTNAYDVMEFIHRLPHLVNLYVGCLTPANTQTDFSIPECAEHEPVAPLDTQIRWLSISHFEQSKPVKLALSMLKYLMLKIPTLKSVTTLPVLTKQIRAFIDEYVQWYPHLANVKLME
ncbi:hypothetical protein H4R19_003511 [Coemansia spiralis]|nr:hypothetical protein H4R19_003511 [Coemansia spiralis]